jgi:DNA-binding NtrC family response regulator
MLVRILLRVDPAPLGRRLARLIAQPNVLVQLAPKRQGLWEALTQESCDLVVLSRAALPGAPREVVSALRQLPDRPELIVLEEEEDPEDRAELLAAGCYEVLSPALADDVLARTLRNLVARRRDAVVTRLRAEQPEGEFHLSDFAAASQPMQELLRLARRVVASDSSLLVLGETGVGKEWLARAVHAGGRRAGAPFLAVNLAAVPEALLESELFGHEKGAFTGAVRSRRGYFELAHRGTLFLDEIGDLSPHLQGKLLRVLQERKIQRVGGEEAIEVDVRVMAATNRDLEQAMRERQFRSDLYYRLGVVTLTVPPLRERKPDIPPLVASYLERFRRQLGRPAQAVKEEALQALVEYPWPGNVRELINVMERAVLLCDGETIRLADLPEAIARHGHGTSPAAASAERPGLPGPTEWLGRPLAEVRREAVAFVERRYLEAQLAATGGRIGETARRAGLNPRSLYGKMRELGLRKEEFRASSAAPRDG